MTGLISEEIMEACDEQMELNSIEDVEVENDYCPSQKNKTLHSLKQKNFMVINTIFPIEFCCSLNVSKLPQLKHANGYGVSVGPITRNFLSIDQLISRFFCLFTFHKRPDFQLSD